MCVCVCFRGRVWVSACVCLHACSLTNAVCNAPLCCQPRLLWLNQAFRHYLINDTIFVKILRSIKCAFRSSLQFLFETFLIIRRIQRVTFINVETSSCKVHVILVGFSWNLHFLDRFEKESWNFKFYKNPSNENRAVLCGHTDGQTWRS